MKILHTSDWHLGRTLYGRRRYDEFNAFLDWLSQTIEEEDVDILVVAGDVFDTSTPSNRAQQLYYQFICRVATSCCRHIVVIAGNHDSPSFLNAPKALLRALNVHVVGSASDALEDEVIVLKRDEQPEAIICAVPYLRDKDLRTLEPGETLEGKNAKLVEGLKHHYAEVCRIAELQRFEFTQQGFGNIPIIGMGHLFAAGGKTIEGDGVRELYVGSLAHVGADFVPPSVDYMALGHLHVPQIVGGDESIRYCGSPIAMGYGEAAQQKMVVLIEFNANNRTIKEIHVPCFQPLLRITGSLEEIKTEITELKSAGSNAWLEIEYNSNEIVGNLREAVDELLESSALEIRRVKNRQILNRVMHQITDGETLDGLEPREVFSRCLDAYAVPAGERSELMACHDEVVKWLQEHDSHAE